MDDLVVISTSIVPPRSVDQPDRVKKIHLTPWDLNLLNLCYLQRGLLFHKPDPKIDIISRLKLSLSIALDHFYPLAGRLVKQVNDEDGTVSFFISCDGSGVKFVHATAMNISLADVLNYPGFVDGFFGSFFPANGIKNYQGVSNPLLMIQVTEMKDGIFISLGYNHTVADGISIWRFLKTWSEICSKDLGSECLETFPPLLVKGWFLDGIDYPIHIPDSETKESSHVSPTSSDLQEKVFHLTKENVLKLKAKANSEVGSADMKISSLQAVLGHVWRSTVRSSDMNIEEKTHCQMAANMRYRLSPPLEGESFGNLSHPGVATTTVGELLNHGLGWAALQINKMVRSQTNEEFKKFAKKLVQSVKNPVNVGGYALLVTNSPQFDVYDNDFGWGKPVAARAGSPYLNGRLVAFRGVKEGSLDLQTCLPTEVMVKLSGDAEFLEYVNVT